MLKRCVTIVLALAIITVSLVSQAVLGTTPPALADQPLSVDLSVSPSGGNTLTLTIGVRNQSSSSDVGLSRVTGVIPPNATVLSSWTGTKTGSNAGLLQGQELSWFGVNVLANGSQGPFNFNVSLPSGSAAIFRATAYPQNPSLATATSKEILVSVPPVAVPGISLQSAPNTADFALPQGQFYKQANGQGATGNTGFSVVDGGLDGQGNQIMMNSGYQALGGPSRIGYPISRRYKEGQDDGFTYQAFQNGVLQWDPASKAVRLTNLMDNMHDAQLDAALQKLGYPPSEPDNSAGDYAKARAERLSWLDDPNYVDFKGAYFNNPDPETLFGLPASHPQTNGAIRVLRLQRAVFATYNNGGVQMASIGDDAKKVGFIAGDAVRPQSPDESDLAAWMFRNPSMTITSSSPLAFKYREEWIQTSSNCDNTILKGDLKDVNGNPVNGEIVRTWNDFGNEVLLTAGLNQPAGFWQRLIGPGIRPGVWHAQVLNPNTKAPLSPVSTVAFTDGCGTGVQEITIHYKANQ